jgi:hypothetical protein
VKPCP